MLKTVLNILSLASEAYGKMLTHDTCFVQLMFQFDDVTIIAE
jgi:hypothetical protein